VLRIGKERANLPIYVLLWSKVPSTYAGNYDAWKPSSALLTLRLVAMLCRDLLAWSCLLAILYWIDANPQSGPEDHV